MDLPVIAIRWLIRNAENNAELATLSNVCRSWRDIAVEVVLEQAENSLKDSGINHDISTLLLLPSMITCLLRSGEADTRIPEMFCIAWFDPSGLLTRAVPLSADYSDEEDNDDDGDGLLSSEPFAPQGGPSYAGSEEEGSRRRRGRSRSPAPLLAAVGGGVRRVETPTKQQARCLYQWNGYREAIDVLRPFGYSQIFVQRVVELAQSKKEMETITSVEKSPIGCDRASEVIEQSTFAVRGATFARPDGYCLCWDIDQPVSDAVSADDSKSGIRQRERKELIKRRGRRRRDLHRLVLPRVVDYNNDRVPTSSAAGKTRQECVQFLNVDGSHAVRIFTPRFKGGPYPTPITIFCVAIATEDGCFVDGLQSRFEFGHLYPQSENDKLIERSPICICTALSQAHQRKAVGADGGYLNCNPDSSNSDDSSCYMGNDVAGGDGSFRCTCQFANVGDSADNDGDEDIPKRICRGRRGPGAWHCYVAVVDGNSSSIRIDGIAEPTSFESHGIETLIPTLDGLTIGSDRTFDMSLCFGLGSDGEGEGAMAELAVFKGKLDMGDIRILEQRLMKKHGIDPPVLNGGDLAQEDQWMRYAHAMLSHAPQHRLHGAGAIHIPLRYLARHRLVAWDQSHAVTGEAVRVQKIGSGKGGYSSSDW